MCRLGVEPLYSTGGLWCIHHVLEVQPRHNGAHLSPDSYSLFLCWQHAGRPSCNNENQADGSQIMKTPPYSCDTKPGVTSIEIDPLEWIHRTTSHISDPERHCKNFMALTPTVARFLWRLKILISGSLNALDEHRRRHVKTLG